MPAQQSFRLPVAVHRAGAAYPRRATLARGGAGAPALAGDVVLSASGAARGATAAQNAPSAPPVALAADLPCRVTYFGTEGRARVAFPVAAFPARANEEFAGVDARGPQQGDWLTLTVETGYATGAEPGPLLPVVVLRVVEDVLGGTKPSGVERVVVAEPAA